MKNRLELAVLLVNGTHNYGDRLWLELSLGSLVRHTSPRTDYRVFLWNHDRENRRVAEYLSAFGSRLHVLDAGTCDLDGFRGERLDVPPERKAYFAGGLHVHRGPLQILYEYAREHYDLETVFTFDTDSWPIRGAWEVPLLHLLGGPVKVVGAWRDELRQVTPPYVHPSCLGIRAATVEELGLRFDREPVPPKEDTLSHFTASVKDRYGEGAILGLNRSNAWQYHQVFNGVYGEAVYHHHLGTRYQEGRIRKPASYGWAERGESMEENKFVLGATTEMVFRLDRYFTNALAYGAESFRYNVYLAYLEAHPGAPSARELLGVAAEHRERDPRLARYLLGLVGGELASEKEFVELSVDVCRRLGLSGEAEAWESLDGA